MKLMWSKRPFFQPIDAYLDWTLEGPGKYYPRPFVKWPATETPTAIGFAPPSAEFDDPNNTKHFEFMRFDTIATIFGTTALQEIDGKGKVISGFLLASDAAKFKFPDATLHAYSIGEITATEVFQDGSAGRVFVSRPLPNDALCVSNKMSKDKLDHGNPPTEGEKTPVIVGIIDEGLAFAHERFRSSLKSSRVQFAWLQDASCAGGVDGFGYGRELTKHNIDQLLALHESDGSVDEDAVYRDAGAADFSRPGHKSLSWRTAHGTHVMDLAAGFSMTDDPNDESTEELNRDDVHIICVQLPTSTVAETSGLGLEKFYVDALRYIYDRASEITHNGKALPVVTNFSSGVRGGPRDGSSFLEAYVDKLVENRNKTAPTLAVLPAGNAHLTQSHAKLRLAPKSSKGFSKSVKWRVQADDRSFSYVEFWLPPNIEYSEKPLVELRITTPRGYESPSLGARIDMGEGMTIIGGAGNNSIVLHADQNEEDIVCKAYFQPVASMSKNDKSRGRFLIALAPTEFLSGEAGGELPGTLAPVGDWTITLENTSDDDIVVNGWIHWDDAPITYSRTGRQSYFTDDKYQRFDPVSGDVFQQDDTESVVKRSGTINGLATGDQPIVVGGYHYREGRPADYSSADFEGMTQNPDFMAVCEDSNVQFGVLGAGTRSGSRVALNGTSVAAPQATRLLAEKLATGMDADTARRELVAKSQADENEVSKKDRKPPTASSKKTVPSGKNRIGNGRLLPSSNRLSQRHRRAR